MKTLRQFTVAVVAVAISLCSCQKTVGKIAPVKSDFTFLKKLDIEPSGDILLGDSLDREPGTAPAHTAILLDLDKQAKPLLGKVIDVIGDPDQMDVMNYVLGIKALPGGYTLVAYERAFDDVSAAYVGIYNKQGEVTDFMNCGTWFQEAPEWQGNDNQCLVRRSKSLLKFVASDKFVIVRDQGLCSGVIDTTSQLGFTKTGCRWKMTKNLHYKIDGRGRIVLEHVDYNKTLNVPAADAFSDEVDETACLPLSSGQACLDKLNRLAARSRLVHFESDGADDAFNGLYGLAWALSERYHYDPQLVLKWMASHRDAGKRRLVQVFEFAFADSMLPKEELVKDIGLMQDLEARRYIEQLTAQWGPRDAVR